MTPYILSGPKRKEEKGRRKVLKTTGASFKFQIDQPNSDERETKANPDSNC